MLYIPKIYDYLKIMTDEKLKNFVVVNFEEYFKSMKEKLYSKLWEKQNVRRVAELLVTFVKVILLIIFVKVEKYATTMQSSFYDNCIHRYNIEVFNLFNPELTMIILPMIINKLKELLNELKKFKVHSILVLEYNKTNDRQIVHSSAKLIVSDSDIDEEFKSRHQTIMTKIKNYASKD